MSGHCTLYSRTLVDFEKHKRLTALLNKNLCVKQYFKVFSMTH